MKKPTILAVLPTIRNLDGCIEWTRVFASCDVIFIVVQDGTASNIKIPSQFFQACREVHHVRWSDIDHLLGDKAWIISRKDSAIRSFAWLWAKAKGINYDFAFSFDDDTKPSSTNHLSQHIENFTTLAKNMMFNTIPQFALNSPVLPRGLLGPERSVYISHGLWTNVPDMSAAVQEELGGIYRWQLPEFKQAVPAGVLYPMCGMNLCFRREIAPLMYFGLMGQDPDGRSWGIGRWDDMFAGWLSKLWLDKIGGAVISGTPYCRHQRASKLESNRQKERLWASSPEFYRLLQLLPGVASQIEATNHTSFLQQLEREVRELCPDESSATGHFLKCLQGAVLFSSFFEK